jgi:hypothetical protein
MPDTIKALLGLLLDPVFATCLVVASVSAIAFFKGKDTRTKGMSIALIALFLLTAAAALFFIVMAVLFGPVPQ